MAICFALVAIVVGSALFHFLSPWRITPIASNWREMDDTLAVTFITTAVFFVAINLLVAYTVYRFRHRPGQRAAYQPDNKKLERWLIVATSLAIIGLLAPGLFVYAKYVRPPAEALQLEVLGQQWQWRYRFPGTSGRLGRSSASLVNAMNPFGLDPGDPAGQDNILVNNNEVHLPTGPPRESIFALARRAARFLRSPVPGSHEHGARHGDVFLVYTDKSRPLRSLVRPAMRRRAFQHEGNRRGRGRSAVPGVAAAAAYLRRRLNAAGGHIRYRRQRRQFARCRSGACPVQGMHRMPFGRRQQRRWPHLERLVWQAGNPCRWQRRRRRCAIPAEVDTRTDGASGQGLSTYHAKGRCVR